MTDVTRYHLRPLFLSNLQDEINRLFDISLPNTRSKIMQESGHNFVPPIDIQDVSDHYLVKADLPGLNPQKIEITIHDNVLDIRGEKEIDKEDKNQDFIKIERSRGTFLRQIALPDAVDSTAVSAKSKHGVLEITIPKSTKAISRKVEVQVNE